MPDALLMIVLFTLAYLTLACLLMKLLEKCGIIEKARRRIKRFQPRVELLEVRIVMDTFSAGSDGIDALDLGLTGQGVHIGQVESGRPGLRGYENPQGEIENNKNWHPEVKPAKVFLQGRDALANKDVDTSDFHATEVAGVMIGKGGNPNKAVAPDAQLYASATRTGGDRYEQGLLHPPIPPEKGSRWRQHRQDGSIPQNRRIPLFGIIPFVTVHRFFAATTEQECRFSPWFLSLIVYKQVEGMRILHRLPNMDFAACSL